MQLSAGCISAGDLLQRVAAACSKRILTVLESLPAQTPELRFEKMKTMLARIKKQLFQLLAILMWLRDTNVQQFLQSGQALLSDVKRRGIQQDGLQDAFFYLHQSIYKRRRQALDVAFASDIMSRGTYAHLPRSILSFNSAEQPATSTTTTDVSSLNMFIGCKLCLSDTIGSNFSAKSIQNGHFHAKKMNYYDISLTLSHSSENAHWIVSSLHFLVKHHSDEGFIDGFPRNPLEERIKAALNIFLQHKSDDIVENAVRDKSILESVFRMCQHTSLSVLLKLLYIQALYHSRNLSEGFSSAKYYDLEASTVLEYYFWPQAKGRTDAYSYLFRLLLPRDVLQDSVKLELFRLLDPISQGSSQVRILIQLPTDTCEKIMEKTMCSGACFSVVNYAMLGMCIKQRLELIYQLLCRSRFFAASADFRIMIDSSRQSICILDAVDKNLSFTICALTGQFITDECHAFWHSLNGAKQGLLDFLGEMNGIIMDINLKRIQSWEDCLLKLHDYEFQTLSKLLRYFVIFDQHHDFVLLSGAESTLDMRWTERLARSVELSDMVCSMYILSKNSEVCRDVLSGKCGKFEVNTIFVIAVEPDLRVSYFIISCCSPCTKAAIPVFGEIVNISSVNSLEGIVASNVRSLHPLLSLLKGNQLICPTSVCGFLATILRIRATLSIVMSSDRVEDILQRQKLYMGNVSAFRDPLGILLKAISDPSQVSRYMASPIIMYSQFRTQIMASTQESETGSNHLWTVSSCGENIWCAFHNINLSVLFFTDISSCRVDNESINQDISRLLPLIKCNASNSIEYSHMALCGQDTDTPFRWEGTRNCLIPADADLLGGRWLVLRPRKVRDTSLELKKTVYVSNPFLEVLSILNNCRDLLELFSSSVTTPFGGVSNMDFSSSSGISKKFGFDLGSVNIDIDPLFFRFQFSTSVVKSRSPQAIAPFVSADLRYKVLTYPASPDIEFLPSKSLDLVCVSCSCPALNRSTADSNLLELYEDLVNFALSMFYKPSQIVDSSEILFDVLKKVSNAVFFPALLAYGIIQNLRSKFEPPSHGTTILESCRIFFNNVLSVWSYSVMIVNGKGGFLCSYCIDLVDGGMQSKSYLINCTGLCGNRLHPSSAYFQSADPSACADYMLLPLLGHTA